VLSKALNLNAGTFALDSACSSSLYAVKYACDMLYDKKADVMLAGGINRADDLTIHAGFCDLMAMSRTGQSRPFSKYADGLIPAEGAGFLTLMRIADAIKENKKYTALSRLWDYQMMAEPCYLFHQKKGK